MAQNEAKVTVTSEDQASDTLKDIGSAAKSAQGDITELGSALDKQSTSIPTLRHAMRDLGATYTAAGTAAAGAIVGIEAVGASFQSAFTGVERTADLPLGKLQELRDTLVQLSTEMPESFQSLSAVSTLGGQLGIAGENIADFTKEVTMFAATTDATLATATTGFGRIAQLTDAGQDSFKNISSALYEVGVNSVATEAQIMTVAQEIATAGDMAGFSADEIIGLAGAFGSLGIQPERARGNVLRIFGQIDKAIAQSGAQLNTWAQLAGMSADEFKNAWGNESGQVFQSIVNGMHGVIESGGNLRGVLADLGVNGVRDAQTMMQIANNNEILTKSMADASEAYITGSSTADAYALVASNVEAKITMLKDTILAVMDAMSHPEIVGAL